MSLRTDRHHALIEDIDSLKIQGCFGLTELGYGNNAIQLETVATYNESPNTFTLNSPSIYSHKFMISNAAFSANYAVIFAQTIVKEKNEGINAFLIRIRDERGNILEGFNRLLGT